MSDHDPTALGTRVLEHFRTIHRDVFLGDPVSNQALKVELVAEDVADDTPCLVLITPWMINGLAFPPDGELPDHLSINGRSYPVFTAEIEGLGVTHSVNLVAATDTLKSQEAGRSVARALAEPFRNAVVRAREVGRVTDPGRRGLLGLPPD